jgi:ABC-type Mn2+/Zn2+ transport system ATPase subunit
MESVANQIPLIHLDDVTLGYGKHIVLNNVRATIYLNDFIGLVGPNGSGKTTLLRAILGMLRPVRGTVSRPMPGFDVRFGYVPQREHLDNLFPLTAFEVVLMGTYRRVGLIRRPQRQDFELARTCLDHVGIRSLEHRLFKTLSGGQKQRTLIARALATKPSILILDEPTNGMDLLSQQSILDLIQELHDRDGLTVIMVSHLLTEVANYVRKIMLVEANEFQIGPVEEILTGSNLSQLYGMPVFVERVRDRNVIVVGGRT